MFITFQLSIYMKHIGRKKFIIKIAILENRFRQQTCYNTWDYPIIIAVLILGLSFQNDSKLCRFAPC